ncbi:MAG: acyloxyacyl hydrolase [Myxococcales bacterium]|jgi:hypothetical protein|nr:acyloxyacyl hydrolase [Myxococcales bacterium]
MLKRGKGNKRWMGAALGMAAGVLCLLLPSWAQAARDTGDGGNRVGSWVETKAETSRVELGVNLGVGGFLGSVSEYLEGGGPAWGITATLAPDELVSYEAAYFGNSNGIDGTSSHLAHNQLQATVHLGPTIDTGVSWKPYIFGGLGVSLISAGGNPHGLGSALQFTLPLGFGADFFTDSTFRIGVRGQYNVGFLGGTAAADVGLPDTFSTTVAAQARF